MVQYSISNILQYLHSMVFDMKTWQLFALLKLIALLTIITVGGTVLHGTIIITILTQYTYYKVWSLTCTSCSLC